MSTGNGRTGTRPVILVVDDEEGIRETLALVFQPHFDVVTARTGAAALDIVRGRRVDVVLLDVRMDGMDGLETFERLRTIDEDVVVIFLTAVSDVSTVVRAVKNGANDYLTKPFDGDGVISAVRKHLQQIRTQRENAALKAVSRDESAARTLVGTSPAMEQVRRLVAQVAPTATTVLIEGASGTGKELVARAIHDGSPRRDKPFVPVHAGALAESLVESELFGHERGAFTGAQARKEGRFEHADGGTLFLDEVGTLKPEVQVKLLRVLQEREIERVGGTQRIAIDIRVVAASNVDLKAAVAEGRFRDDLYYRLNVMRIPMPALRERREDIPDLVAHFIRRLGRGRPDKAVREIAPEALHALQSYAFPGNVRELENIIERAVALASGSRIEREDLPMEVEVGVGQPGTAVEGEETWDLKKAAESAERSLIQRALRRVGGNQREAARLLGVHRNTLQDRLAKMRRESDGGGPQ